MFGASQQKGFGFGAQTGGFGQPAAGGFGAPAAAAAGGFGGGAFGQAATPATGGFGQPAATGFGGFGQQQQQQPQQSGGLFGQQPATNAFGGGGFGAVAAPATGGFGAPAAGTATPFGGGATTGFGAAAAAPATGGFGGAGGFGAATGTTGGFGQTTGAFGQPAQQTSNVFGSTGGFGATPAAQPGGFGATQPAAGFGAAGGFGGLGVGGAAGQGTGNPPYRQENFLDGGTTLLQTAITAMAQYSNKSFEELRWEDYQLGKTGKTGAAGGFGGAATTGFGATTQPATGGFGGFGSTTTPATTGGFGQPAAQGGFGQPATGGFGQPAAAGGFGAAAGTGGGFGAGAGAGAGGFGSTAPATGGLFGGTSTVGGFGAAKPGGFGAAAATPSPFGASTATNAFGKPAAPATGGFGAPAATGGFGATATTGFGAGAGGFGAAANQAKPGGFGGFGAATSTAPGGFGAPAQTTSTPFGGGFGQAPAAGSALGGAGGGLFGKPAGAPAFGQPAQTTGGFGGFGAPAATSQPATGGGFGGFGTAGGFGQTQQPAQTGFGTAGGFGTSTGLGGGFGGIPSTPAPQQPQQPMIMPYSPLGSLKTLMDTAKAKQAAQPTQGSTPTNNTTPAKPKPPVSFAPNFIFSPAPRKPMGIAPVPNTRKSLLTLQLPRTAIDNGGASGDGIGSEVKRTNGAITASKQKPGPESYFYFEDTDNYFTDPSLEDLQNQSLDKLKNLRIFVVGHRQYGEVEFRGPLDITTLRKIHKGQPLDKIVVFSPRNVEVYPQDSDKPDVGNGLNRPARITLKDCYPPGYEENSMSEEAKSKYLRRLQRNTDKIGGSECSFNWNTGDYSFQVQHFTKYGLLDDDSDVDMDERPTVPPPRQAPPASKPPSRAPSASRFAPPPPVSQPKGPSPAKKWGLPDSDTNMSSEGDISSEEDEEGVPMDDEQVSRASSPSVAGPPRNNAESPDVSTAPRVVPGRRTVPESASRHESPAPTVPVRRVEPTQQRSTPGGLVSDRLMRGYDREKLQERSFALGRDAMDDDPGYVPTSALVRPPVQQHAPSKPPQEVVVPMSLRSTVLAVEQQVAVAPGQGSLSLAMQVMDKKETQPRRYAMGRSFGVSWGPGGKLVCSYVAKAPKNSGDRRTFANLVTVKHLTPPPVLPVHDPLGKRLVPPSKCALPATSTPLPCVVCAASTGEQVDPRDPFRGMVVAYCTSCKEKSVRHIETLLKCRWDLNSSMKDSDGLQLNKEGAKELSRLLGEAYGLLGEESGVWAGQASYHKHMWDLVAALWCLNCEGANYPSTDRQVLQRREVSRWLKGAVHESVAKESEMAQGDCLNQSMTLLSGGLVKAAVDTVASSCAGGMRLAMLLSQAGGTQSVQDAIREQMELWKSAGFAQTISPERWMLYQVAAGVLEHGHPLDVCTVYPNFARAGGAIGVIGAIGGGVSDGVKRPKCGLFAKLDWRRALGMLLWYGATPDDSLGVIVDTYRHSVDDMACAGPDTPFKETSKQQGNTWLSKLPRANGLLRRSEIVYADDVTDTTFSLIELAKSAKSGHAVNAIETRLRPRGYVQSWVEKALGPSSLPVWLLCDVIGALSSVEEGGKDAGREEGKGVRDWERYRRVVVSLAAELEGWGMWPWAVWVLRHLDCGGNNGGWDQAIFDSVLRNYGQDAGTAQGQARGRLLHDILLDDSYNFQRHAEALWLLYTGKALAAARDISSLGRYGFFPLSAGRPGGLPAVCIDLLMDTCAQSLADMSQDQETEHEGSGEQIVALIADMAKNAHSPALQVLREQLAVPGDDVIMDATSLLDLTSIRPHPSLEEKCLWANIAEKRMRDHHLDQTEERFLDSRAELASIYQVATDLLADLAGR